MKYRKLFDFKLHNVLSNSGDAKTRKIEFEIIIEKKVKNYKKKLKRNKKSKFTFNDLLNDFI